MLDSYGHIPISSVLKIVRTAGNLTNVASKMPQQERYTDWYKKRIFFVFFFVCVLPNLLVSQNTKKKKPSKFY